ncbi:MAG: alpha-mannosidase [Eubacterium sp.]|nr:alpha-mannosidase [Eubacterium sp.]
MQKNKIFTVSTSHLDTVWRWELAKTIDEFLPDTIEKNFELLEKYPHYRFNFEGAFRYELIEEYYPEAFKIIQKYAKQGRWNPSGSAYENGDVNIPSPEGIFRNFLLGNRYFYEKLGRKTTDVFLPDCFGFGWALPSIARHSRLNGFTTQKLGWGAAYERPYNLGLWRGVDGKQIFACLAPLSYRNKFAGSIRGDVRVIEKIAQNAMSFNIPWAYCFYGTGDWGGAPTEESVYTVERSISHNARDKNTEVVSATTDDIFNELQALSEKEQITLPLWNSELLMRSHGVGSYTSRAMSKRLNSKNEVLADYTERACVLADLLTSYKYPQKAINSAWKKVIAHQFHDDITGTSTMKVYNESWNDYFVALSQFKNEYEGATGAIANELDTSWCQECAVIVNNPVAIKRKAPVEAHIKLQHNASHIKVLDKKGREVPSQIVRKQGKEFDIIFLADVESVGFKVYDVQTSKKDYSGKSDLVITEHTLDNSKYRVVLNKNGDIASIYDKKLKKQLLSSPIKLAALHNRGELNYPSWELRKEDIDSKPYAYANTPEFEIVENGAARITLKVTRHIEYSKIVQLISLDSQGETLNVENRIDWQERRTLLKAQFPLTCSNYEASYDLGLGYIKRGTNKKSLYEVPAQKWADITDEDESFGVSIFSDCKYGWDKPEDNMLRLTCIHTPAGAFTKDARQDLQDIGRNIFSFAICSHKGKISSTTQLGSELFLKKLCAFQTSSRREGRLKDSVSLLKISSKNALVRAVKLAEDGDGIVIRINEALGKVHKEITLSAISEIIEAQEIYASEEFKKDAKIVNGSLVFKLKPFEIKSFKIRIRADKNNARESFKKLELPYNTAGITSDEYKVNTILSGTGCSLPEELLKKNYTVHGITFRLPDTSLEKNLLIPREQEIEIPKALTRLYILAASLDENEREITILADNKERKITVYPLREPYGKWDMAGLAQSAKVYDGNIGLELTHLHHPEGNLANQKGYFYLYEIDVRNAKRITLPYDNKVVILAMTGVKRFSNTCLATELIDRPDENYTFGEIPPVDKLIDKADFVTIRAGKIQDQMKSGRGKGFKRNNPITNIIRSYTKSEW